MPTLNDQPLVDAESVQRYAEDALACWVQDIDAHRILWANTPAVALLNATSIEELLARDVTPLSRAARTRLLTFRRKVSLGKVLRVNWIAHARGKPVTLFSEVYGFQNADGRMLLFFRARDVSAALSEESRRSLASARHSTASNFIFTIEGCAVEQNAASVREFGELDDTMRDIVDQFAALFVDSAAANRVREQLRAIEVVRERAMLRTLSGARWFLVVTQPILDPVDGSQVLHVECADLSDLMLAESKARDAQRLTQKIADELAHPVTYVDRDRVLRFANQTYCRWIGKSAAELVGRRIDDVEGNSLVRLWNAHWPTVERGERVTFEVQREVGALGKRWFSFDAIPFRAAEPQTDSPNAEIAGAIVFGYDVNALKVAQAGLAAKQLEMARVADSLPVAVCKFDREGTILFANALFCEWFGIAHELAIGRHVAEAVGAEAYTSNKSMRDRAYAGETVMWRRFISVSGRDVWHDITLAPSTGVDGQIDSLISVYVDVTVRVQAHQELSQTRSTLSSHLENTPLAVIEMTADRHVNEWTGRAEEIFAWGRADVVGRQIDELRLFDEDARARFLSELNWLDNSAAARFTLQLRSLRRDGGLIHAEWYGSVLRTVDGRVSGYLMLVQDISAKVVAEHHLAYVANHDLLTGLANRSQFQERLQTDIGRAHRHGRTLLVVLIDLDRFKLVNDSLGHQAGDSLLQAVASRMRSAVGEGDLLARAGGDEFMVLVDLEQQPSRADEVVAGLRDALAAPFHVMGQDVFVTASVGASCYPADAETATDLIKHADWAMFRAKDAGRNSVQFFSDAMVNESGAQLSLEADLRRVIETKQLELHYQPKVDIATSRVTGAEALLRWRHPTRGLVPPESFIPLAEEMGLIVELGAWVISESCRQLAEWRDVHGTTIQMAINLSAVQLRRPGLPDGILAELSRHGLPGGALMVEVTETSVVTDPILAAESLQALRRQGVHAAIDDFGKGFSSLVQLKRLPIDALKIDGSFVRDLVNDRDDAAIVNAIIGLAHNLGLKVVAEGVETPDQLAFLKKSGCDEAQGYLIARPVPPKEFALAFLGPPSAGS